MLIFDKSFLQSLSVDEAVILDQMFSCVVTPLFFVETMADLTKATERGRTAEQVVGGLAERTPVAHSYVNTYHQQVVLDDLLGHRRDEFDHRPAVAGGIPVRVEGKAGVVYRKSPEREAFDRWQDGRFLDVERRFAQHWRASLAAIDLPAIAKAYKALMRREDRPKSHRAARDLARRMVDAGGQNYRSVLLAHDHSGRTWINLLAGIGGNRVLDPKMGRDLLRALPHSVEIAHGVSLTGSMSASREQVIVLQDHNRASCAEAGGAAPLRQRSSVCSTVMRSAAIGSPYMNLMTSSMPPVSQRS
jgi:hypothetical protein